MNLRAVSGFLMGPANEAYTPDGVRRIEFTVIIRDDLGHEYPERVMVEDEGLLARVEGRLLAGAAVVASGRGRAWPIYGRGGAHVGWDRWLFADSVEITRAVGVAKESEVL